MEDGIKSVDPAAKMVVSNAGWMHYAYFEVLARQGVKIDVIGYHWYESAGDLKDVLDILRTEYAGKPVWFTEVNRRYSGAGPAMGLKPGALKKYIRTIRNRGTNVRGFFVYELFDQPTATEGERGYGMIAWVKPYLTFVYKPFALELRSLIATFALPPASLRAR